MKMLSRQLNITLAFMGGRKSGGINLGVIALRSILSEFMKE